MDVALTRSPLYGRAWAWVGFGAALTVIAAAVTGINTAMDRTSISGSIAIGVTVVLGLALVGIGMAIRLNTRAVVTFAGNQKARSILLSALILFQCAIAGAATWSLVAALLGVDPTEPSRSTIFVPPPLRPGLGFLIWLLVAPMAISGALHAVMQLSKPDEWTRTHDIAALLMVSTVATLASGFALNDPDRYVSMTFFLGVLTAFLASAVSFVLLPVRRQVLVVSALILLHFGAITTATLAAPPSSWVMGQLWSRLARPYLEFMYLNNAYHFYSPDPGPATYLWFRVFYDTGEKDPDTGKKKLYGTWVKIPDIKDDGTPNYNVALEYQRHLSLTEQVIATEVTPQLFYRSVDGKSMPKPQPFFASRLWNSPEKQMLLAGQMVGKEMPKTVLEVPFLQVLPNEQQYQMPNLTARRMIESYVQHVAKTSADTSRNWPVHSIKVYKVTHIIPPWQIFVMGSLEPTDPEFYRPFYMGEYSTDGKLLDETEPLLFWLLPNIRRSATKNSLIDSYALIHAGDPMNVYNPQTKIWMRRDDPVKEPLR